MIAKPSKSAKKRESLSLQALGEQLIGLSSKQLNSIGLDKRLHKAVVDANSMRDRGALKRQKQLIGKLMRDVVDPKLIRAAIESSGIKERLEKIIFKQTTYWRDRITVEGTDALEEFFEHIGHQNDLLTNSVESWLNEVNDCARTKIKRSMFREIHNEIYLKVQNDTGTV